MLEDPKLVLEEDVMRFILALPGPQRQRLLQHLRHLKSHWTEEPDFRERGFSDR